MKRLGIIFFSALTSLGAQSQWASPDDQPGRGLIPIGSYTPTEMDVVDNVSGSLGLSIPLAVLPRGRGGSTFTVGIHYESTIYDLARGQVTTASGPATGQALTQSSTGGWRYNFQQAQLIYDDRTVYPVQIGAPNDTCAYQENKTPFKLRISLLEGSIHELYRSGSTSGDNWDNFDFHGTQRERQRRGDVHGGEPDHDRAVRGRQSVF